MPSPPPFAPPSPMHCNTHCTLLATQTSAVVTTTCLDYLHSHNRTMRLFTASPIYLYACSQQISGVVPPPGAPRSRRDTATHTARDSDLGSDNRDMSGLSALAYPSDAPIHRLTDIPLRLLSTDIGCGTLAPRSQTTRGNTHCSRPRPRQWQPRHVWTTSTRIPEPSGYGREGRLPTGNWAPTRPAKQQAKFVGNELR
jgi:hypothetical protein